MKKIASFTINHDKLDIGMYVSRIDGDIITYDIRIKRPNNPENDYLSTPISHTIEHIFATFARNTKFQNNIVYVGPMGCRTGFYLLLRDTVSKKDAIELVKDSFKFIKDFEGEIPGAKKVECGNYKEHDLAGAKETAAYMYKALENWSEDKLIYEE